MGKLNQYREIGFLTGINDIAEDTVCALAELGVVSIDVSNRPVIENAWQLAYQQLSETLELIPVVPSGYTWNNLVRYWQEFEFAEIDRSGHLVLQLEAGGADYWRQSSPWADTYLSVMREFVSNLALARYPVNERSA